jgi:long-chain acyl-CoA synthetase
MDTGGIKPFARECKMDKRFYVDENKPWFKKEAGWPDEVPKNIDFPDMSLGDMLRESAKKYPDYRVIYFLGKSVTYRELNDYVDRVASAFAKLGIKKGDVVALMLPNSIQYVICYYATVRLGAIVSGINPTYKPAEVLHQLKTIGAKALVVLDSLYESTIAPIIDKTDIKILIGTNIADFLDLGFIKEVLGKLLNKIPSGKLPSGTLMLRSLARHS